MNLFMQNHLSNAEAVLLPASVGTLADEWGYAAPKGLRFDHLRPAAICVRAKSVRGNVGLCLISEDYQTVVSTSHELDPSEGETVVVFDLKPENAPVRLLNPPEITAPRA